MSEPMVRLILNVNDMGDGKVAVEILSEGMSLEQDEVVALLKTALEVMESGPLVPTVHREW